MAIEQQVNRRWIFRHYVAPDEYPKEEHFSLEESPIPEIADGQVLIRIILLGTSPAQRMYVTKESTFHIKVAPGEVMSGRGVGVVVESRHPGFEQGTIVQGSFGWQDYVAIAPGPDITDGGHVSPVQRVDQAVTPLTTILGIFGQLAFSAYIAMIEIGKVQPGDTVVVSSAAGGVGSIACQLARIQGAARVIGIAGGTDKCRWLLDQELCDVALDYKQNDFADQLRDSLPTGVDVYLDSVGGDMLDSVLENITQGARVVLCGHISTEYQNPRPPGPTHYYNLLYQRARMEGFFVFDYLTRWPEFEVKLREWQSQGKLKSVDHVFDGLEQTPAALTSLFDGSHTGGCVVRLTEDPAHLPSL